ncbi:coiled-coil domain-containing protein 172-like [Nelusetta ayraudi]|uniref:coiled-coil domain-containing protein 172-like n=1 Tax=Nelusetta ayraudi TaxID=303726 RepID=UPI003F721751
MSLDTLFKQILLTEQQLNEQTQRNKEVKLTISKCTEKIKSISEKCKNTNEELDKKAQRLSTMRMQRDAMKKCQDQMLKQIEELLCQKRQLSDRLAKIKTEAKEVEKEFLEEISGFNREFSLGGGGEALIQSRKQSETLELEREVETLRREMELMSSGDRRLRSVREEKRRLQLELQGLDTVQTDLEQQLAGAQAATEVLRAERQFVSQKPQTDRTCLKLREELESYDNGELELQRETLNAELHFLKSELDVSQRRERH